MPSNSEDSLSDLTDPQLKGLQDDAVTRIKEASSRIQYAEGRRGTFAALSLGFIAAGVALLATLLTNNGGISFRPGLWSLVAFGVGVITTGAVVLLQYAAQTNFDYPFKVAVKTWKWFYRDALPDAQTVDTPWHTHLRPSSKAAATSAFEKAWPAFLARERKLIDQRESTEQDLSQLYVLYANEFYKNRFLTQLRKTFQLGVVGTFVASVVVLVITWLCN